MDVINDKSTHALLQSLLAEIAKTQHEIRCAQRDLDKARSRNSFSIMVINELINRQKD